MTNIIRSADTFLGRIYTALRKRPFLSGVLIYTLFFSFYFCLTMLRGLIETGSLLASDGISQYYPFLLSFRRDLIAFFNSIGSGSPTLNMMNFNFAYGSDTYTGTYGDFLPFLPYYIFSPLVPEEGIPLFYGIGTVILTYISGISFIFLCGYFGRNTVTAGFFAPFYAFCGSFIFTAAYNQHFLYMFVTFPLLIVGIDKIICGKSFALFTVSAFVLSLSGLTFLIYTMPFVVLFALIRVYFVHKGHYFSKLLPCFLKGAGAMLLGVALASFIFLPGMYDFLNGARSGIGHRLGMQDLLPDISYMAETFVPTTADSQTGISAAMLPFLIFALIDPKGKKELKIYTIAILLLTFLPVIRLGLNAFNYYICRWGFIPALLLCFISADAVPAMLRADKKRVILFTAVTAGYIVTLLLGLEGISAVILTAVFVISAIPALKRVCAFAGGKIRALYQRIRSNESAFPIVRSGLIIAGAVLLIIYVIIVIINRTELYPFICVSAAAGVTAAWAFLASERKQTNSRYIISTLLAVILTVCAVPYIYTSNMFLSQVEELPEAAHACYIWLPEASDDNGTFGRRSYLIYPSYDSDLSEEEEEETEEDTPEAEEDTNDENGYVIVEGDEFSDAALRFDIPDTYIFKSSIDSDLTALYRRCGQDSNSALSQVDYDDFGGKEVLDSLFGIRYIFSISEMDTFFGAENKRVVSDGTYEFFYYDNKYALPVGVTYSAAADKDRFDAFDAASLPYAMMNEIYLEGFGTGADLKKRDTVYAEKCDITHNKKYRGETAKGIDAYDNTITINSDTSDCFVYITFEGVNEIMETEAKKQSFDITVNDERIVGSMIHNRASDWPWAYYNDHYTIPLGFHENGVKTLEFISPFEYENMYVSAVPSSFLTQAYDELTKETLRDVTLSPNTLSGNITVSDNKILSVNMIHSDGWKAYVDGVNVPVYKANGVFLGIPLEKGTHAVRLEYTSPMLAEGIAVSAAGLVVFIVLLVFSRKKTGKKGEQS